jgi:membrane protein implicated in regulation of membrane protease activity
LLVVVVVLSVFGKHLIPGVLAALGMPSWLLPVLWIACALAVFAAVVTAVAVRLRRYLDEQRNGDGER